MVLPTLSSLSYGPPETLHRCQPAQRGTEALGGGARAPQAEEKGQLPFCTGSKECSPRACLLPVPPLLSAELGSQCGIVLGDGALH